MFDYSITDNNDKYKISTYRNNFLIIKPRFDFTNAIAAQS